jgi:hypothetical protein
MPRYFIRSTLFLIATVLSTFHDKSRAFVVNGKRGWTIHLAGSLGNNESVWKAEGERIIMEAATKVGALPEQVDIQWKPGRIIVTLSGEVKLNAIDEDEGVEIEYDGDIDQNEISSFEEEFDLGNDDLSEDEGSSNIVTIARAINFALGEEGEDSIGYSIAEHHEIEVTTPGNSEELQGIMFESYKGFDVIVEELDKKDIGKIKILECKFVERTDDKTIVNVKGRLRKIKNEFVKSIRLPKAKKEKGVR